MRAVVSAGNLGWQVDSSLAENCPIKHEAEVDTGSCRSGWERRKGCDFVTRRGQTHLGSPDP